MPRGLRAGQGPGVAEPTPERLDLGLETLWKVWRPTLAAADGTQALHTHELS